MCIVVRWCGRDDEVLFKAWRHEDGAIAPRKIIRCKEMLPPPVAMPVSESRQDDSKVAALAGYYFDTPATSGLRSSATPPRFKCLLCVTPVRNAGGAMCPWIAGFLELPALAIKDAETVGEVSQVFFVSDCQDEAGNGYSTTQLVIC
jgi:hypothetical protein